MKKILLIISLLVISLLSFAAQLNPFAYGLRSELSDDQSTLTVRYSLNSTATSVTVVVMNGNTVVKEKDCSSLGLTKGNYTTTFSTADFPTYAELTWKVEVKGDAVASPTFVKNDVRLYAPTSVDIDNNPENANFGTVFCVESRDGGKGNDTYLSEKDGMGLYIFNADGTPRTIPNEATERYGYDGAITDLLTTTVFNSSPVGTEIKGNSYFLYRVRR
jgi:hypothetical protein